VPDAVGDRGGGDPEQNLARASPDPVEPGDQRTDEPQGEQTHRRGDGARNDPLDAVPQEVREHRDDAADDAEHKAGERRLPRRAAQFGGVDGQLFPGQGIEGRRLVLKDLVGHPFGLGPVHALGLVDQDELFFFFFRGLFQFLGLDFQLVLVELPGVLHRQPLAQGHRERAGQQPALGNNRAAQEAAGLEAARRFQAEEAARTAAEQEAATQALLLAMQAEEEDQPVEDDAAIARRMQNEWNG